MQNDTYVELLVARKKSPLMQMLRFVTAGAAVVLVLIGLFNLLFLIAAAACAVIAYFVYLNADLEYEYLYVDRQLSVDKVMAKSRRKKAAEYDLNRMEILAPVGSAHLADYQNRSYQTVDFSSGVAGKPNRYAMYYDGTKKVLLEPDEAMLRAIRNVAPRKVFTD